MNNLSFSGEIAKVARNNADAVVKLDRSVGGVSFAVLRHTLVGDKFPFRVGLAVAGTGEIKGQTLVAITAYAMPDVEAVRTDPATEARQVPKRTGALSGLLKGYKISLPTQAGFTLSMGTEPIQYPASAGKMDEFVGPKRSPRRAAKSAVPHKKGTGRKGTGSLG